MKKVRYFRSRSGDEPFVRWFSFIKDRTARAQIDNRVRRLSLGQKGDYKRVVKGVYERVVKGVYELRIHYGSGFRVYFSQHNPDFIILLLGGGKNSQKSDIKQAKSYWECYKEQYNEES